MEANNKNKDLEEDEELKALRLAALATLKAKRKEISDESNNVDYASSPINKIVTVSSNINESDSSQIPFVQSDRNIYSHPWRKQNQPNRRRGGGQYPKTSQRSNLIVISPVTLDDSKDSEPRKNTEKPPSSLVLPHHRWCNSGNEDSLSPKTLRRTGPIRFNRHGSDSESSESDYEDSDSDNDSASNETLLQDEPQEPFQSLESNIKSDAYDKGETTSVYNCLKNSNSSLSYSENRSGGYTSVQNIGRNTWSHSHENNYSSYNQYGSQSYSSDQLDSSGGFPGNHRNSSQMTNGEIQAPPTSDIPVWQNTITGNSYYTKDNTSLSESSGIHGVNMREKYYSAGRNSMQNDIQKYDDSSWQHVERTNSQYFSRDQSRNAANNNELKCSEQKVQSLSHSDLRLELQKRIQKEYNSQKEASGNQNESVTMEQQDQRSSWSTNIQRFKQDDRNENSHRYKSSFGQNYDRDSSQNPFTSRRHERSLSYERRKERSPSRDKNMLDFEIKDKNEDSYDHKKYIQKRTSNYDRDRRKRSYSRDQSSSERSSSRERNKYEQNSTHSKRFCKRSSSRERIKHDQRVNTDKTKLKRSPSSTSAELSSNLCKAREDGNICQDETRAEHNTNHKHSKSVNQKYDKNLQDRSSSHERSQRERSWSQGSERLQDFGQDGKKIKKSLSPDRNRHKRSLSHEKIRNDRSSSHGRSRRGHSSSRSRSRGRHDYSPNRSKRCHRSQDKYESNSSPGKPRHNSNPDKSAKIHLTPEKYKNSNSVSTLEKGKKDSAEEKIKQNVPSYGERRSRHQQIKSKEKSHRQRSTSKERYNKDRKSPFRRHSEKSSHTERNERSRSRNSSRSSSSSNTSSSSYTSRPKLRSVPSVIKSVPPKNLNSKSRETFNDSQLDLNSSTKREIGDHNKLTTVKSDQADNDQKNNASDINKRVPVHMRLGTFPRKRLIQMTKDVEAAFVNSSSSSDESVSTKGKRQNLRIFADVISSKSGTDSQKKQLDKSDKIATDTFKERSRRLKTYR